jgi:hypothetical protein
MFCLLVFMVSVRAVTTSDAYDVFVMNVCERFVICSGATAAVLAALPPCCMHAASDASC